MCVYSTVPHKIIRLDLVHLSAIALNIEKNPNSDVNKENCFQQGFKILKNMPLLAKIESL